MLSLLTRYYPVFGNPRFYARLNVGFRRCYCPDQFFLCFISFIFSNFLRMKIKQLICGQIKVGQNNLMIFDILLTGIIQCDLNLIQCVMTSNQCHFKSVKVTIIMILSRSYLRNILFKLPS